MLWWLSVSCWHMARLCTAVLLRRVCVPRSFSVLIGKSSTDTAAVVPVYVRTCVYSHRILYDRYTGASKHVTGTRYRSTCTSIRVAVFRAHDHSATIRQRVCARGRRVQSMLSRSSAPLLQYRGPTWYSVGPGAIRSALWDPYVLQVLRRKSCQVWYVLSTVN